MMTKRTTLLLLLTFFFTACAERGYTPKPIKHTFSKPIIKKSVIHSKIVTTPKIEPVIVKNIEKNITVKKTKSVTKQTVVPQKIKPVMEEDTSIFTLTHETKNKISGFLIFIIGIIILL